MCLCEGSGLFIYMKSHLLAVVKHSEEEHGHQEQGRLFGPQEVSVGAKREKTLLKGSFCHFTV